MEYLLFLLIRTLTLLVLSPNGLLLFTGVGLLRNFESTGSIDFFSIKTVFNESKNKNILLNLIIFTYFFLLLFRQTNTFNNNFWNCLIS